VAAASLRFWRQPATKSALLVALLFLARALVGWYLAFIEAVIVVVIALCQPWKVVFTRRTAIIAYADRGDCRCRLDSWLSVPFDFRGEHAVGTLFS
jgi:hypothetical protein